jgi:hypothetical protein
VATSFFSIYSELRRGYPGSEKRKSDAAFWLYPLYRVCSFPIAALFIRLGVSANQVTCFGVVLYVLSFAAFVSGLPQAPVLGALFYVASFLLDFADGTIARFHGRPNAFGKLIDGLADSATFTLFIAVAIANVRAGTNVFVPEVEISCGVAATLAAMFAQNYEFRAMYLLHESGLGEKSSAAFRPSPRQGVVERVNVFYRNSITMTPILLLVSAPWGLMSIALLFFLLVHVGLGLPRVVFGILGVRRKLASIYRAT